MKLEEQVLLRYLPNNMFRFCNIDTSLPYFQAAVKAKDGTVYLLYFDLSKFPKSSPRVFVQQMLHTYLNEPMDSISDQNYTLKSWNGWTQLYHYTDYNWNSDISLWKVYLICCVWIEMYRNHLDTGKPMNYYFDYLYSDNLDRVFRDGKQLFGLEDPHPSNNPDDL